MKWLHVCEIHVMNRNKEFMSFLFSFALFYRSNSSQATAVMPRIDIFGPSSGPAFGVRSMVQRRRERFR